MEFGHCEHGVKLKGYPGPLDFDKRHRRKHGLKAGDAEDARGSTLAAPADARA